MRRTNGRKGESGRSPARETAAASRNGRRQGNTPYHETDGHAGPRRTEIVPAAAAQKPPAVLPDIAVVFRPDVSHAQHRLDVPSPADDPLVSVGKPRAVEEALVTAVAHAEELHTPGVVVGIEDMKPEKMPGETPAEPVAEFGLRRPELEFPVVSEGPGVVAARHLPRGPRVQPHLESGVERRRRPIERVRPDGEPRPGRPEGRTFLRRCARTREQCKTEQDCRFVQIVFHHIAIL